MTKGSLKENTIAAVLIAMTVALSILVVIPIPATKGIITLCSWYLYQCYFVRSANGLISWWR